MWIKLWRAVRSLAVVLVSVVILFEEWLWEPLKRLMLALSRLPLIRQLASAISRLPPYAALALYLVPVAVLLPFKMAGLWLIGTGHPLLGLETFLGAKITGTAILAWLFSLTRPALMKIHWFARLYGWIARVSETAHAWLHRQPAYRALHAAIARLRAWFSRPKRRDPER